MAKKKRKIWYYVTWYDKYPIYEPAEGGYYYEGLHAGGYCKFRTLKRAKKYLENGNHAYEESHYIGEGTVMHIETVLGIHTCGYVPYC